MTKPITALPGVGDARAQDLNRLGFRTLADIANATPEALSAVPGIRTQRALQLITAARILLAEEGAAPAAKPRRRTGSSATAAPAAPPARKTISRAKSARTTGQAATSDSSTASPGQPQAPAARTARTSAPKPPMTKTPVLSAVTAAQEPPARASSPAPAQEQASVKPTPKAKRVKKELPSHTLALTPDPQDPDAKRDKPKKGG